MQSVTPTSIKAINYADILNIQEIDVTSSHNSQ